MFGGRHCSLSCHPDVFVSGLEPAIPEDHKQLFTMLPSALKPIIDTMKDDEVLNS